jgi:hypothetical protein
MAIDIQPPNYSGLVALAGKNVPLNIQPTGALGLQALQEKYNNEASLRDAALKQMQLQQQGQLGLLSNQTQNRQLDMQQAQQQQQNAMAQNDLAYKQQQLAQQNNQFNQSLNQDQSKINAQGNQFNQELDLKNRILAEQTSKDQMAKLLADTKAKIQEKGAFASYGLMAMSGAKTSDEQQQIRTTILQEAKANHYMSDDEIQLASQMPLSQFTNGLKFKVMQFGQAKEYKDMINAQKAQNPTSGLTQVFDPNTGQLVYSSNMTKPNETQAQKDIMFANDNVAELKQLYKNVPEEFFGATALGQPATKVREWAQNIPIIGKAIGPSDEAKKSLESYSGLQSTSNMLSMNIIKQLSGVQYSDKQLEFMNQILPQFGPSTVKSEFNGRAENLLRFFDEIKNNRDQLLKSGIPIGSPEYKDQMLNIMQNAVTKVTSGSDLFTQYRNNPEYKDWSDDKIKRAMHLQGL